MMDSRPETILTRETLHWGLIITVVLIALALLVLTLPGLFILKMVANLAAQTSPRTAHFTSWLPLWLLLPSSLTLLLGLGIRWIAYLTSEITLTEYRVIFRTAFFSGNLANCLWRTLKAFSSLNLFWDGSSDTEQSR
jgi:H+/Cl- antiporter ClcA